MGGCGGQLFHPLRAGSAPMTDPVARLNAALERAAATPPSFGGGRFLSYGVVVSGGAFDLGLHRRDCWWSPDKLLKSFPTE